jgi:hypothetical protein
MGKLLTSAVRGTLDPPGSRPKLSQCPARERWLTHNVLLVEEPEAPPPSARPHHRNPCTKGTH